MQTNENEIGSVEWQKSLEEIMAGLKVENERIRKALKMRGIQPPPRSRAARVDKNTIWFD